MVEDGSDALWGGAGDDILFADGYQGYDGTTTEPGQGGYGGGGTGERPEWTVKLEYGPHGFDDDACRRHGRPGHRHRRGRRDGRVLHATGLFCTAAAYSTVIEALDFVV